MEQGERKLVGPEAGGGDAGSRVGQGDVPKLIPLAKWERYFEDPTIGSMRWMVWRAEHYGLTHCIKRVGRRIWIDQEAFWAWLGGQEA